MCLYKSDKEKYEDTLKRQAKEEGIKEEEFIAFIGLIKRVFLTLQQAAESLNMTVESFETAINENIN